MKPFRAHDTIFWGTVIGLTLGAFAGLMAVIALATSFTPHRLLVWWPAENQVTVQSSPTPSQPPAFLDTTDWQTFRNEEYQFEVMYPNDWRARSKNENTIIDKENCQFSIWQVPNDYINEQQKIKGELLQKGCRTEQQSINGIEFEKITCPAKLLLAGVLSGEYHFQKDGRYYVIGLSNFAELLKAKGASLPPDYDTECQSYFSQILSTFKFTQGEIATKFTVTKRIPEGTTDAMPDAAKALSEPLNTIELFFNRDLTKGSITTDHVYVLSGIQNPEPETLSYSSQDKKITIRLNNPFKIAGARLTVVVDGIRDIQGDILNNYLYNIDFK